VIRKEKYTAPAEERQRTASVTCDLCEAEFNEACDLRDTIKWSGDYTEHETTVSHSKSSGGQYGGYGDHAIYHVCPKCFVEKLEPWLKSQGAQPTIIEFDW